jgi:hypothetical protein
MPKVPSVISVENVEMIRDGGSLAATYNSEGAGRHILFTKIRIAQGDSLTSERLCYEQPILIDCDPAKRPLDTDRIHYSKLSGPAVSVTWEEARVLVAGFSRLADGLNEFGMMRLRRLEHVVSTDGGLPPNIERYLRRRPRPAPPGKQ